MATRPTQPSSPSSRWWPAGAPAPERWWPAGARPPDRRRPRDLLGRALRPAPRRRPRRPAARRRRALRPRLQQAPRPPRPAPPPGLDADGLPAALPVRPPAHLHADDYTHTPGKNLSDDLPADPVLDSGLVAASNDLAGAPRTSSPGPPAGLRAPHLPELHAHFDALLEPLRDQAELLQRDLSSRC